MRGIHVFIFCCLSGVGAGASVVLEVSGHVGGEVSIHCPGSWTTDNNSEDFNMYFCKGDCSRGNTLIQTERRSLAFTRRGRYSMEVSRGDGAFNVTIKGLRRADAGRYHCGVGRTFNVLYQEVILMVLNASIVPSGSPPSTTTTTTLWTEAQTLTQGSVQPSIEPSPAALTPPAAQEKTNQRAASKLTDTTVVIIVSVSLALLVCAIIPLIFYGHYWSKPECQGATKGQSDCCEGDADVASTQITVGLQSLETEADPESSALDDSQYAAVYQALDPQSLD